MTALVAQSELDENLQEFSKLALDVLLETPRRVDLMMHPIGRPEQHPMARIARRAIQRDEVAQTRATLERRFQEELAEARDRRAAQRQIANILAIYDATVKRDPIELREAVKLAAKPKRTEWSEAV